MKLNQILASVAMGLGFSSTVQLPGKSVTNGTGRRREWPAPKVVQQLRGKAYPEQSLRQKLRGMRRAQGGPGLRDF